MNSHLLGTGSTNDKIEILDENCRKDKDPDKTKTEVLILHTKNQFKCSDFRV